MKFKNILDPECQVFSLNKVDKIFKNKSLNNSFCRNDCRNIKTLYCCIYWNSAFLYTVIKWTVNVTRVWVKMLSLLQILSVLITSLSQGPMSQGLRSQGPWVPGPRSRVPGLRS